MTGLATVQWSRARGRHGWQPLPPVVLDAVLDDAALRGAWVERVGEAARYATSCTTCRAWESVVDRDATRLTVHSALVPTADVGCRVRAGGVAVTVHAQQETL